MDIRNPRRYARAMLDLYAPEHQFEIEVPAEQRGALIEVFRDLGCQAQPHENRPDRVRVECSGLQLPDEDPPTPM